LSTRRWIILLSLLTIWTSACAVAGPAPQGIDFAHINDRVASGDLSEEEARQLIQVAEHIKERAKRNLTLTQRLKRAVLNPWVAFGLAAQAMFMMRFVLQWIASEKRQRSYVPVAFWYFSLAGGLMLLTYAVQRRDPVFTLGQGLGCFIYIRNLRLIYKRRGTQRELQGLRRGRNNAAATGAENGGGATPPGKGPDGQQEVD
jgi:lipid-A-disaccharide synthase-like uncharacterized protein